MFPAATRPTSPSSACEPSAHRIDELDAGLVRDTFLNDTLLAAG
jgi:hypothetical protein